MSSICHTTTDVVNSTQPTTDLKHRLGVALEAAARLQGGAEWLVSDAADLLEEIQQLAAATPDVNIACAFKAAGRLLDFGQNAEGELEVVVTELDFAGI
jgi:hypothetical protein